MGDLLFWTVAVFAVLAGPPLVILLLDAHRAGRKPRQLEDYRRCEAARTARQPREGGDPGSSATIGVWPGAALLAWIV
jgi:hypothetical protein